MSLLNTLKSVSDDKRRHKGEGESENQEHYEIYQMKLKLFKLNGTIKINKQRIATVWVYLTRPESYNIHT